MAKAQTTSTELEKVFFIKGGSAYGYGYGPGEFGTVRKDDLKDRDGSDRQGKPKIIKGLLALGVVRVATDEEYNEHIAKVEKEVAQRNRGAITDASMTARGASPGVSPEMFQALADRLDASEKRSDALEKELAALKSAPPAPPAPPAHPAPPASDEAKK